MIVTPTNRALGKIKKEKEECDILTPPFLIDRDEISIGLAA